MAEYIASSGARVADDSDHHMIKMIMPAHLHDIDRLIIPAWALGPDWHCHPYHELVYVLEHHYQVRIGDQELHGGPGSVFCYPSGLRHHPERSGNQRPRIILMSWTGGSEPPPLLQEDHDGRLLMGLLMLWDLQRGGEVAPQDVLDGMLAAFLFRAAPNPGLATATLAARARAYLSQNLAYNLDLPELAAACGSSTATLNRACRAAWGISPMRLRRRLRAEHALALLRLGQGTVADIAQAVGYGSGEHLARVLRMELGISASALRGLRAGLTQSP